MKLSKAQQDLLDAMRRGVRVFYMGGVNAYWFRADTNAACSPTVLALLDRGLIRHSGRDGLMEIVDEQ